MAQADSEEADVEYVALNPTCKYKDVQAPNWRFRLVTWDEVQALVFV